VGYPGRLANAIAQRWPQALRVGRAVFDITDRSRVLDTINQLRPVVVVNCAALTDMKRCEQEQQLAWAVNVIGVRNLAEACQRIGAFFVQISSDYALKPVNEYAWTKRASEAFADLTIRAKLYDHSHWAWDSLMHGSSVKLLTTEFLNPISTTTLALTIEHLLKRGTRGLVAVGTRERLSFWEVGRVWAHALRVNPDLVEAVEQIESTLPRLVDMYLDPVPLAAISIPVFSLEEDAALHLEAMQSDSQ